MYNWVALFPIQHMSLIEARCCVSLSHWRKSRIRPFLKPVQFPQIKLPMLKSSKQRKLRSIFIIVIFEVTTNSGNFGYWNLEWTIQPIKPVLSFIWIMANGHLHSMCTLAPEFQFDHYISIDVMVYVVL